MGIVNVTPDSFYDGGRLMNEKELLIHVEKMLNDGATIIDVGGYSSRPGATDVPLEEEKVRVISAIRSIKNKFASTIISVDTFRSPVARAAIEEGAAMINDISAGELDADMFTTVANLNVPYICMHMRGTPQTMQTITTYDNLLHEIIGYFHKKIAELHAHGVNDIILDPGFGFAKTPEQNFKLLNHLEHLTILGKPLLVGLSRKSMIWNTLRTDAGQALNGTTALNMVALMKGSSILRVHDAKEAVECLALFKSLNS